MITKIRMDEPNRMVRFGFGKNNGKFFVRLDFWYIGYRLTWKNK